MVKIKNPLMSLKASGSLTKTLTFLRRGGRHIVEKKPEIPDARSLAQLSWRHMYQKAVALWHALSIPEKQEWESSARPKHMTGFAYFMSQCLRPNPGLYLPLQGGKMAGEIDMDGYRIEDVPDPVAAQDADTQAARDAAIAAAIGGSLTCDIYGYDGSNWHKLLVESAAHHNLRVSIYSSGAGVSAETLDSPYIIDSKTGLVVNSALRLSHHDLGRWYEWRTASAITDDMSGSQFPTIGLMGYDGSKWDRLRAYETGVLKTGRAGIGLLDTRMTGTGQVGAAQARKLYWVSMNPSAANSLLQLSDAAAPGGAIKWDMFHSTRMGHMVTFDPPLEFSTGIYVETWTSMTSAVFGYL